MQERLPALREDARIERETLLEMRGRHGEDPLDSLSEVPSVDAFVVRAVRDEMLEEQGRLPEFALARLASRGSGPDAAIHRRNADRVEFALLRQIAEICPDLTVAIWERVSALDLSEE
ncbi:hypothetical protein GCM10009768_07110 [Leucobacter iarius]|uniref:Uncharacterized protein n=1 Tax=Leucobacter iarius TaxID=333963 RepID=A0ABN2L9T0_9MICO